MKIRQAQTNDIKRIIALFVAAIENTCTQDYDTKQIEVWTSTRNNLERWKTAILEQHFLLAENDKELLGFGSLKGNNYIDFLYVSHLATRQGIAKALLEKLEIKALSLEAVTLNSDVSITAKPFFEKMGFKAIHPNRNIRDGIELINYRMTKKILTK